MSDQNEVKRNKSQDFKLTSYRYLVKTIEHYQDRSTWTKYKISNDVIELHEKLYILVITTSL